MLSFVSAWSMLRDTTWQRRPVGTDPTPARGINALVCGYSYLLAPAVDAWNDHVSIQAASSAGVILRQTLGVAVLHLREVMWIPRERW